MRVIMCKCVLLSCLFLMSGNKIDAQKAKSLFKLFGPDEMEGFSFTRPIRFYEVLCTKAGTIKITSTLGVWSGSGVDFELNFYMIGKDNKRFRAYNNEDGIKTMYESPDQLVFFATHDNKIFWQPNDQGGVGCPSFIFPSNEQTRISISKIWIDGENNMFIGTYSDTLYFVNEGAKFSGFEGGMDSVGNFYITKGEKPVKNIVLGSNVGVFSFANDPVDKQGIWIGTNKGLFFYRKDQENLTSIFPANLSVGITITHLEVDENRNIWFSTLEKGMGFYDAFSKNCQFFHFDKGKQSAYSSIGYPIKTFCRKSSNEFFVAVIDSLPAIFNAESKTYSFIQDSIFKKTKDSTTDIKLDGFGNLFLIKGGGLYYSNAFKENKDYAIVKLDSSAFAPFIRNIEISGERYGGTTRNLKEIRLKHFENKIQIHCSLVEYWEAHNVQFAWKVEGYMNEWIEMPIKGEETGFAFLGPLDPGKYIFLLKAKVGKGDWRKQQAQLIIIITPPLWQTWWFWSAVIAVTGLLIFLIVKLRVRSVRKQERLKAAHEKELIELEAKALRAQMNPHFIFNCMNSIKSLIQQNENEKSVTYLTTFSKLIRILFNNADKKEISLYDELETCKLYLQLEAMRFDDGFTYNIPIDGSLDLKSVTVPALVVQPFIENAIWHGIVPRGYGGHIDLVVQQTNGSVEIIIDDNGIGREASRQNKPAISFTHQSQGVNLSQSRLELDNLLKQRQATLRIIDKKDESGKSAGTTVIIRFNEQLS